MLATTELAALNTSEIDELVEFEAIIEQSQALFIEVGNSLMAIRDAKLYRATHTTFEAYLAERWPAISKRRGYQLIDAAAIAKSVPITNERQARALKNVPVETAKAAYQQASAAANGTPPTAKAIQAVLQPDPNLKQWIARGKAVGLLITWLSPFYTVTDEHGIRSQYGSLGSICELVEISEQTARLQAQALATVAPLPEPEPIASQELIAARRYQSKLCTGMHNLAQSKDRQQVRTLCSDLIDCLATLDGLPTTFDKAIEAVLTMAADLLSNEDFTTLANRLDGAMVQ